MIQIQKYINVFAYYKPDSESKEIKNLTITKCRNGSYISNITKYCLDYDELPMVNFALNKTM